MSEKRKRRARNPEATHEAILTAARTILAKDGQEALSLSKVAQLAEVNRGTAYQHFATREKLIAATLKSVSDKIFREVFGDPETSLGAFGCCRFSLLPILLKIRFGANMPGPLGGLPKRSLPNPISI